MEQQNRKLKGIGLIMCSALSFALMTAMVKLADGIPVFEKAFFRNAVAVVIAAAAVIRSGTKLEIPKGSGRYVLARSFFGTCGLLLNFYAVSNINLADASVLNKLSPFFAVVFSVFLLKEKLRPVQVITLIGAFIGALFVIKPNGAGLTTIPAIGGFFGGMFAGLAYACVRKASLGGTKGTVIVLCFSAFSCLATIPFIAVNFVMPTVKQLVILCLCGVFGAAGQFCITAAYACAPAKEISVFDYSQVIFSAILSFILFDALPDRWSFVGYVLIIGMAVLNFVYNNRLAAETHAA